MQKCLKGRVQDVPHQGGKKHGVKQDGPGAGTTVDLNKMLDAYYKLRGWDKNGIPTRQKLEELGLSDVAEALGLRGKDTRKRKGAKE